MLAGISPRYRKFIQLYKSDARLAYPVLAHGNPVLHKGTGLQLVDS